MKYRIQYQCVSDEGKLQKIANQEIYGICLDLAIKVKNANCDSKFYTAQLAMDAALDNRTPQ